MYRPRVAVVTNEKLKDGGRPFKLMKAVKSSWGWRTGCGWAGGGVYKCKNVFTLVT